MFSAWRQVSKQSASSVALMTHLIVLILCVATAHVSASPLGMQRIPSDASLLAPFRKLPNSIFATRPASPRNQIVSTGLPSSNTASEALVYPVMGPRKSSDYGMRKHPKLKTTRHHHGVDLAAPHGAPIRAISSGTVIYADPWGGYGNVVVLKHDDGITTSHYGHCKTIRVKAGQRIPAGKVVGTVGSTGISTGPHLHFEVRVNGKPSNPERFLPGLADASNG